ncbi:MAG TPA: hypothetical protein VJ767_07635 [Nitrososphaeraceae archaeon]|nr:hypothetical protein [Nitrososphaeraceae archaeon]
MLVKRIDITEIPQEPSDMMAPVEAANAQAAPNTQNGYGFG